MNGTPDWAPAEVDTTRPSVARVYDYLLGGYHNFSADREVADRLTAITPMAATTAFANRAFLQRAVSHLLDQGIEQFLDIGSGIPTVGNVHETAQETNPDARVVYVDIDPVAVTHANLLLAGNDHAAAIQGDLHDIDDILAHPEVHRLIDFTQPVAVLLVAVLHFIPDEDDPAAIVGRIARAVTPGSYLVLSHLTGDNADQVNQAKAVYNSTTAHAVTRTHDEIQRLFNGFSLIPPGLVRCSHWHPTRTATPTAEPAVPDYGYAAVARKA